MSAGGMLLDSYNWGPIFYISCSAILVIGITLIASFSLAICRYFQKPKKNKQPPSPMCKRQVSIHAVYPPTPHIIRLPHNCLEIEPDSPSLTPVHVMDQPQYPTLQEAKTNAVVLQPLRLASLSRFSSRTRCDSAGSSIIRMSSLEEEDLPVVHGQSG